MAIEEVFFDMFSDLIILVLESTSIVGTRPIRKYFLDFCNSFGNMDSNRLQLEGQSEEFEQTWAIDRFHCHAIKK